MARERVREKTIEPKKEEVVQEVANEDFNETAINEADENADEDVVEEVKVDKQDEVATDEVATFEKLGGGILGLPGNVTVTGVAGTTFKYPKNKIPLAIKDLVREV
jgi:hypothetical protein